MSTNDKPLIFHTMQIPTFEEAKKAAEFVRPFARGEKSCRTRYYSEIGDFIKSEDTLKAYTYAGGGNVGRPTNTEFAQECEWVSGYCSRCYHFEEGYNI